MFEKLVIVLALAACKKQDEARAVTPTSRFATVAELRASWKAEHAKVIAIWEAGGTDCAKIAASLEKLYETDKPIWDAQGDFIAANPNAMDYVAEETAMQKDLEAKSAKGMAACGSDQAVIDALSRPSQGKD
jgi:hypothetical protein